MDEGREKEKGEWESEGCLCLLHATCLFSLWPQAIIFCVYIYLLCDCLFYVYLISVAFRLSVFCIGGLMISWFTFFGSF